MASCHSGPTLVVRELNLSFRGPKQSPNVYALDTIICHRKFANRPFRLLASQRRFNIFVNRLWAKLPA